MITINYLSHNRKQFWKYWEITSYYLNRIKEENKKKIKLNILATKKYDWGKHLYGIDYTIYDNFPDVELNYLEKMPISLSSKSEYSVKLDEDCFISNYVWDYLIENINVLDDDDNLIVTTMLSNGIPLTDRFIENFVIDEEIRDRIYQCYLNRPMPNGLWGVNYTPLNKHTIESKQWNSKEYFDGVSNLNSIWKGMHPIRIDYHSQWILNDYIIENFDRLMEKRNYSIKIFKEPYFTSSFYAIKTEDWRKVFNLSFSDNYDEIKLNLYRERNNKNFLYVDNGFSIHTMYNTICGRRHKWGVELGMPGTIDDALIYELGFVEKLNEKLQKQ